MNDPFTAAPQGGSPASSSPSAGAAGSHPAFWANTPVRFSHLRAYGRSPMHGRHARLAPKGDETLAMERGTALHAVIFGTRKVVMYPGAVRRGKEYDAFAEKHKDAEILGGKEYEKVMRMAESITGHADAMSLLKGVTEETILFRWMGLECRATPDVRGTDYLTELKSSQSSDPAKFLWHARRMHYHAQLRFQEFACEKHHFPAVRDHWIVCVESDAPHPVTIFHVEPEALEEGEKLLISWAETLKNCEKSNNFPGYAICAIPLVWPKDDVLEFEEAA